ncbi:MAG: dihydrolipoamide acetyltransferase family protein [Chitinophagales bacterium]
MIEFKMPSLGADMEDGILREWRVKPGDTVKRGDIIAEVEVQKGNIDIECFDDGIIEALLVKENEKVPVGIVMALIRSANEPATTTVTAPVSTIQTNTTPSTLQEIKAPQLSAIIEQTERSPVFTTSGIKATPLAKRIAAEHHIDLSTLKGTGDEGAITKEDVEKAIEEGISSEVPPKNLTPAENIRLAVAAAMSKSNREIPHYYLEKKVDVTKALAWLTEQNAQRPIQQRLLQVVLFIKAGAKALKDVPELNAVWENGLIKKEGIHIGFVVSLKGGGIMVPAIHDVDKKSLDEIMASLNDLIPRARALKLRSSELSDSTITMTSLGEGGADKVYGVIYPPQVAIIGIGGVIKEIAATNGENREQAYIYATLAGDHRATDGLTGSKFLAAFHHYLQQPESL